MVYYFSQIAVWPEVESSIFYWEGNISALFGVPVVLYFLSFIYHPRNTYSADLLVNLLLPDFLHAVRCCELCDFRLFKIPHELILSAKNPLSLVLPVVFEFSDLRNMQTVG